MSDKVHCDRCDNVIPDNVPRLTLQVGVAKGGSFESEEFPHEFCAACTRNDPTLLQLFEEFQK